jgi:hypothetical protein
MVLLGEVNKMVPVSRVRFANIDASVSGSTTVDLLGAAGETVVVAFTRSGAQDRSVAKTSCTLSDVGKCSLVLKTTDEDAMIAGPGPLPRETVNFDFAWGFQRAAEPRYQQCTFQQNVTYGTGQIWAGATASKEECCNECANHETCRAWAWDGHECLVRDNSAASSVEVTCAAGYKLGGGSLHIANLSSVQAAVLWCRTSARCAGFTAQTSSCNHSSSASDEQEPQDVLQYEFHDSWGVQHKSVSAGWVSWVVPTLPPPGHWSGRLGAPWAENATSPARSTKDYNDSMWEVVDAPHDFGRTRMSHCQATGRRRRLEPAAVGSAAPDSQPDFVNNCSGWYRKHFSLPTEWRQGVVSNATASLFR